MRGERGWDLCGTATIDADGANPPCENPAIYRLRVPEAAMTVCPDHLAPMIEHCISEHRVVVVDKGV